MFFLFIFYLFTKKVQLKLVFSYVYSVSKIIFFNYPNIYVYNTFLIQNHCTTFNFSLQPFVTRRVTKTALEWRIRNLTYPKHIYCVSAEDDGSLTVRTSNKKYFKKIVIPDLERIGLKPEQDRISFTHQYNTLIITVLFSSVNILY